MTEQTTNHDETVDSEASDAGGSDSDPVGVNPEAATEKDGAASKEEGDPTAEAGASATGDGGVQSADVHDEAVPKGTADEARGRASSTGDGVADRSGLQSEFDALNDRHLRLVAEFNNFRRRSEQERMSAWTRAQGDLVGKLLDVLDDLQRVADLDLSNASVEAIMEGIDLVERKFMRQLEEAGVEMVDPEGEAFDPERMEAMMRVPAETDAQVDTVAQVFQKGYSLKGTLVRPARVSVYTRG